MAVRRPLSLAGRWALAASGAALAAGLGAGSLAAPAAQLTSSSAPFSSSAPPFAASSPATTIASTAPTSPSVTPATTVPGTHTGEPWGSRSFVAILVGAGVIGAVLLLPLVRRRPAAT